MSKYKVLDKGFVHLTEILGNDLTVVNAARVSYGKRKTYWDEKDEKLVRYLKNHKHYSPFRHVVIRFHVKAPEFVTRQWYKHVVGIETTSDYATKDHAWNEISGRYMKVDDYYYPELWRKQSESSKQGSDGELNLSDQETVKAIYDNVVDTVVKGYEDMLNLGVAKEQARIMLPLSQYTEFYWTASFQAVMNFLELRNKPDAQWEVREFAKIIEKQMRGNLPEITKIWLDG